MRQLYLSLLFLCIFITDTKLYAQCEEKDEDSLPTITVGASRRTFFGDIPTALKAKNRALRLTTYLFGEYTVKTPFAKIGQLCRLKKLTVQYGDYSTFPQDLALFSHDSLEVFELYNCTIDSLPTDDWHLPRLKTLSINGQDNGIFIPTSIERLKSLEILMVLVAGKIEIPAVGELKKLKELYLSGDLYEMPKGLMSLKQLKLLRLPSENFTKKELQQLKKALSDTKIEFY